MRELTEGRGADVVFDAVGGDAFDEALRAMNWERRLLVISFASGRIPSAPANIILVKNISVVGVVFGTHSGHDPAGTGRILRALLEWHEEGRLKPRVAASPMRETTKAIARAALAQARRQGRAGEREERVAALDLHRAAESRFAEAACMRPAGRLEPLAEPAADATCGCR